MAGGRPAVIIVGYRTDCTGHCDQLTGRIEETYGITEDQAELQVKAFEEIHEEYRPTTSA
jgi:hypothetical protein